MNLVILRLNIRRERNNKKIRRVRMILIQKMMKMTRMIVRKKIMVEDNNFVKETPEQKKKRLAK